MRNGLRAMILGICCVCLAGFSAKAQTFRIGSRYSIKGTAFDPKSKTFYALWQDSLRAFYAPDYSRSRLIRLNKFDRDFPEAYQPVFLDSVMHLVHLSGGMVYRLEADSLRRIDRSFNHKMQINSSIFVRNDTIMRYGGYGFWSIRNFFTYYSPETHEWDVVRPLGSEVFPPGTESSLIAQDADAIYVIGGKALVPSDPYTYRPLGEAWRFSVQEGRWDLLGKIPQNYEEYYTFIPMGERVFLADIHTRRYLLLNPGQNRITYYPVTASNQFYPHNSKLNAMRSYYADGKFYLLRFGAPNQGPVTTSSLMVEVIGEAEFLGTPIGEEPLYRKEGFPWKPAGGVLGAAAVLGLLAFGRKKYLERGKIVVSEKGARYRGRRIDLDPKSLAVLNLLLRSEAEVPSQKVLDLVENTALTAAHNIKVKNQLIDALNFRFRTLLELDHDLIEAARSEEDKRIKVFQLDKSHFRAR